ncbi:RDD domain containing protein [Methanolacinia petrolearia DSM 11571]|uniref:RDD domain containing protein n=1 Tax=Methanolacinia petrolearia (strain DSM 11571 / OCM 486 / SEBR 4847) TaxID=679926 RepID=E1RIS3_METP4|nr:RDD domain containing protein [Methanolacinia petrolearia DSM 11571]
MVYNFCPNCGDEPEFKGAEIYTNCGFNEPSGSEKKIYAGFWIRFVAYVIDTIIIGAVCLVVVFLAFMLMGSDAWIEALAYIFCIFFPWFYFATGRVHRNRRQSENGHSVL